MLHIKPLECTKNFTQILINIMGSGKRKMCIINDRLRDKKPLSQKLIVRSSRFHEFLIKPQSVISGCGPCTAPIRISRRARDSNPHELALNGFQDRRITVLTSPPIWGKSNKF